MKLRDEHIRSYIDDIKMIGLLKFLTWQGLDVAAAWIGAYEPDTRSEDEELVSLARFNRAHYLFYRALVEKFVEKQGDILDVGSGSGHRTRMLGRYANSVLGIERDLQKISVGSTLNKAGNILWAMGEFEQWQQELPKDFDYVFAVEVIEHVQLDRQKDFMGKLKDRVRHGGALLMTTPRDKPPNRVQPHIGLWDDAIAAERVGQIGGEILYFNVKQLDNGGDDPWCPKDESSHYVVVARR